MRSFKAIARVVSWPEFWPLLFVVVLAALASRTLFGAGYFNMHDDLQIMRQLSMEKCFWDGQIPCRWITDMGYGFGYPLFNFYPPLPYLVGQVLRVVGYSYVATAKGLFIVSIFASGVTMYYLAKEFFGKLGGVVAATFYIWAPYHAVDIYVRGAMNEAWGLIWFPAILLFSYKLLEHARKPTLWVIGLALSWFALFTSHNLMVVVFLPFFAAWVVLWLVYFRNLRGLLHLVVAGVWSFGLAAFFTLPVIFEKDLVQTGTLVAGYYNYIVHFTSVNQLLFSRFWGYGPSVWLTADEMSFQIGWLHWGLSLVLGAIGGARLAKKRKVDAVVLVVLFAFLSGWAAAFMTHPRSTPIWLLVDYLSFIQFPWRYLTMVILAFSLLAGASTKLFSGTVKMIVIPLLLIGVVVYSWNYFIPEGGKLGPLTDEEKLEGLAWEKQQTAGIFDYLPNTAKTAPKAPREALATVVAGEAEVRSEELTTNRAAFEIDVSEEALVQVGILQFPGWSAFIDGESIGTFVPEDEDWGRIHVLVPEGTHTVTLEFHNTPVRTIGDYISLISWAVLGIALIARRKLFRATI